MNQAWGAQRRLDLEASRRTELLLRALGNKVSDVLSPEESIILVNWGFWENE